MLHMKEKWVKHEGFAVEGFIVVVLLACRHYLDEQGVWDQVAFFGEPAF